MAIVAGVCNVFKRDCMLGLHDLDTDVIKIALYTSAATLSAATSAYSATNEVSGTGYTATGETLSSVAVTLDSGAAIVDFANPVWTTATITARGALIYNSSSADRAIAVIDFGSDKTSTGSDFEIIAPAAAAATAAVRLA